MRYFNVYLYESCPVEQNVENYPSYWVWKIENTTSNAEVPQNAQKMSLAELQQYKQTHKNTYNNWINSKIEIQTIVDKKVKKAIAGVNSAINKYCAENIVKGITQANKTKLIADTLKDVFYYAQSGSLYECLTALDQVQITQEMSPFFTEAIRTELKNKINSLLANL